jgi:ATP-dependent DNA helicase DinG
MIRTFADAEQVLASTLPGYKQRPQQQALAAGVERLLASEEPVQLLAQAGCGVGKSLGSLIPVILKARMSGDRIIVATATKALQEQYANTDVPFLEQNLGVPFTWALLKGRSNYVCVAKLAETNSLEIPGVEALRTELSNPEHSGDFEHLTTPVAAENKRFLSMSGNECPGKTDCPFSADCFAEKARNKAKDADVVITNTAMLMTDLKVKLMSGGVAQMLGEYDAVIIDEGHELPEIAANTLADQMRRRGMEVLIDQVEGFVSSHQGEDVTEEFLATLKEGRNKVEEIFAHLESLLADAEKDTSQLVLSLDEMHAHAEPYVLLIEALRELYGTLVTTQITHGDPLKETIRQQRLGRRLMNLDGRLTELLITGHEMVRWVEVEVTRKNEKLITLNWSPVEVGPFLNEHLWSKTSVALVSATLAVGNDFSYIINELGLTGVETMDVGTPFDYKTQARLFVPDRTTPDPSARTRGAWQSHAQHTTRALVEASGGGALLLFTSRKAMKDSYELLSTVLEMAGMTCLMQGEHGTNKEIAARFKSDTHSVLFALKSFFTGVDFSGDTCRLVIIDKLPFPVPSDIMFNAKAELINLRHHDDWASFNHLSVPMMTLTLVQGFGRLIRSVSDRGVVAILDPRLVSKNYGKKILKALPPAPMTHKVSDVADFFSAN